MGKIVKGVPQAPLTVGKDVPMDNYKVGTISPKGRQTRSGKTAEEDFVVMRGTKASPGFNTGTLMHADLNNHAKFFVDGSLKKDKKTGEYSGELMDEASFAVVDGLITTL